MQNTRFKFTKKAIERLPAPEALVTYHDTETRGLKVVARPSGSKTFILYRKIAGTPERISIGRFPDISIEQARDKASAYNAQIADKINPRDQQRALSQEITLGKLFEQYLARHAKPHKKSWSADQGQFQRYLTAWAKRKLSSIKKIDVQRLHQQLGENNGRYGANRLLALLHTLFNKAIEWGWPHPNPVHGIKKFKEKSRDRFLQADELPRFFQALQAEVNDAARDYILVSLLTGARKSNVLAMRWQDISFERKLWVIPETKHGDPHTVPLVKIALDILRTRHQQHSSSKWVSPSHGKTGHLVEPKRVWERILQRANIKDLRLHDLRRSLGSWQAATGANLSVIGKTLAHKNVSTTAIYARLNIDSVRDAVDKATTAMFQSGYLTEDVTDD